MIRLVVCDSFDATWMARARAESRAGDVWHVLVLRVSADRFAGRHGAALASIGTVLVADVAALAGPAHRDVAPFVLDLLAGLPGARLGRATLGAWLDDPARNLWWSLEISERSPFRSRIIERLYHLALVARAAESIGSDEIWIELHDTELAETIAAADGLSVKRPAAARTAFPVTAAAFTFRYWARAAMAFGRWAAVRLVVAGSRWPNVPAGRAAVGMFTIYPYWWIQPFAPGAVDRFFSAPPDTAHYAAWLMWPRQLWRNRREIAQTVERRHITPLQRFVSLRDALGLLSPARFLKLLRVRGAVRRLTSRFGRFDISRLVANEIVASLTDAELFFDHLIERGVARYLTTVKPTTVLYRFEGQPWENALLASAHRTGTRVLGFFHSPFGENYPALRFARDEIAGPGHGAGPRPLPDGMLVCGTTVRRHLEADGYPTSRIAECGPQRHAGFVRFLRQRPARAELRGRFGMPQDIPIHYVALAIVEAETDGLFACLEAALESAGDFRLLIKTHPNRPRGDASLDAAVRSIGAGRTEYVPPGADMYDYLAASDTMICIGSTVAFEAMALGVMPVVYEHPGTFAATSLRAFDEALYVVNSPATMRRALAEIADGAPAARARRTRFDEVVRGVFGDLETPLDLQLSRAMAGLAAAPRLEAAH